LNRAIPGSQLVVLDTHGHCPHLSDPALVVGAIRDFLA
jgi:sigma-B regulation protein RsbQ